MTKLTILTKFAPIWSIWSIWSHEIFEAVVMQMTLHYLHYCTLEARKCAASTKRLHKYSRLEAANTGHQSYSLMKSRAQDTAPVLEAPDTEHTGGSKSRAGIKFRRNERSDLNNQSKGVPPLCDTPFDFANERNQIRSRTVRTSSLMRGL